MDALIGVDLNLLMALHLLLDERSVTRAARRARVSQPTMSRWLLGLRELTNDPILVREGRRMVPTARALAVRHQLAEALTGLDSVLEGRPFFDPATSERVITLAIGDFSAAWVAPGLLRRVREVAPKVSLRIVPIRGDDDDRLATGEVDLMLGRADMRVSSTERTGVGEEVLVGVARPGHPFSKQAPTLDAWLQSHHVLLDAPMTRGVDVERLLREHEAHTRILMRLPYYLSLPRILAELDAVGVMPARVAAVFERDAQLSTFPLPITLKSYTSQLLWSTARDSDPVVTWFRERVLEEVEATFGAPVD